jgi:hypothetical protein
MSLVNGCGTIVGTKEHFIAFVLFSKRVESHMSMTIDNLEERSSG